MTIEDASQHFGLLAPLVSLDGPTSSTLTRDRFGWLPTRPALIPDIDEGHYFRQ
jgi:hypothetical protein